MERLEPMSGCLARGESSETCSRESGPIGASTKSNVRTERDTFGELQVPAEKYWGAQTQRSLQNFNIGGPAERIPEPVIKAFAIIKKAAAQVNMETHLDKTVGNAIVQAADEVRVGGYCEGGKRGAFAASGVVSSEGSTWNNPCLMSGSDWSKGRVLDFHLLFSPSLPPPTPPPALPFPPRPIPTYHGNRSARKVTDRGGACLMFPIQRESTSTGLYMSNDG
ncbi:hypothetical protein BDK51DRAFT_38120 [Blyttiomyces helicus]|uniref:Fumarate lyase N-terminal domain-containing protein n=1 Tax=Blyttiomyces helicus TaxID=388810 RepID=A0A4P9VZV0_9FUNG|nr:hypothetical protein BDK51DRAFT_38120 [Blyttiomyces helicus]|eukprot:RKO84882.1 hypothetical protein BDK51DRAFT_38120 [Blyttiomyces helicus]